MVQYNNLGSEFFSALRGCVLAVTTYIATTQFLFHKIRKVMYIAEYKLYIQTKKFKELLTHFNRNILHVETNIITRYSFCKSFVMHFNRFYFSSQVGWGKCNNHSWFHNTSFNSTNWDCSNTLKIIIVTLSNNTKKLEIARKLLTTLKQNTYHQFYIHLAVGDEEVYPKVLMEVP